MPSTNQQINDFANLISQAKTLERFKGQFYWRDYPQPQRWESVAEHSWRLGILITLFAPMLSKPVDLAKAYEMAMIHDIPEIVSGDASPLGESGTVQDSHAFNQEKWQKRLELDRPAARQVFGILDEETAARLYDLWLEFETQSSFEARVVKSLDRLEAWLQVHEWRQGHLFPAHLEFNLKYVPKGSDVDPALEQFAEYLMDQLKQDYREFTK